MNGISRKEVRKVYVNGKYSHTETVKNSYVYKQPVNQQGWYGTKVVSKPGKHRPDYVKEVFRLVNLEREKAGLPKWDYGSERMLNIANIRAEEIYKDFDHGGSNKRYGEAIHRGKGMTPIQAVQGWMNSSAHKSILMKNMNAGNYARIGVFEKDGMICYVFLISDSGN